MHKALNDLKSHLLEVSDLNNISAVLGWDQATYMPSGGGPARARQLSTLSRIAHEKATAPAIGKLLDSLAKLADQPDDSDDAAYVRAARRNYERQVRIPAELVAELTEHTTLSYETWAQARPANNFARMVPLLEKTVDLSRRIADCFPGYSHIADPLIDWADYGMHVDSVRTLFAALRSELVPIVQSITNRPAADDSCLHQFYPEAEQLAFGEQIVHAFGYDFERGRQDKTLHPFCTTFAIGDVRITTRFQDHNLGDGLFSTLHESGHAMYEQGVDVNFEGGPLMGGTSAGVHESQSRLWENLVGRSLPFWEHYYPQLQQRFPSQLGNVSLDSFYRAINKVSPSLIRVDADEVTYNLHVIIRFDLELALLEGSLAVRDLPEAWHERYRNDLGITPQNDRDGVMQDVHWYAGPIGGSFQGYSIGNLLSVQFFDTALAQQPQIINEIGQGQFSSLHGWLRQNIYQYGSKYTAPELIKRVTGGPLRIEPYIAYLRKKYGTLYQ